MTGEREEEGRQEERDQPEVDGGEVEVVLEGDGYNVNKFVWKKGMKNKFDNYRRKEHQKSMQDDADLNMV